MPADSTPAIRLSGVSRHFGEVKALDRIDLEIADGEFFSMLGPSGSGKTTCLRLIAGFDRPTAGRIEIQGVDVSGRPPYERDVNTVFQDYALFPHMTVGDNIAYGLMIKKVPKNEREKRVAEMLDLVQLPGLAARKPSQLSGGQRQRVALARALINHPRVLLLDEPLGALDLKLRQAMQIELKAIQQRVGITFIFVTHDQEEALTMSDVIVVMRDGLIQQMGGPTELYERPINRFVADFIGSSNFMEGTVETIEGPAAPVVVRTDRGLALRGWITDPAASPTVGQAVTVVTRPERLEIAAQGDPEPGPGWTAVAGRIHQGTYLGDQTEFRVQTDGAGDLIVRRQNATGAGAAQGLGPGQPVTVRWREEANLVLVS